MNRDRPNFAQYQQRFGHASHTFVLPPVDTPTTAAAFVELCIEELTEHEAAYLFEYGACWLTRGRQKPKRLYVANQTLQRGDALHVYINLDVLKVPVDGVRIVEHRADFSVAHKPAGMLLYGSKYGDYGCLFRQVERITGQSVYPVHRLDRYTQGLIVMAHHKAAAHQLSQLFEQRRVSKRYHCVVKGRFKVAATCEAHLDDKASQTRFTPLSYDEQEGISLLLAEPFTGRKHQIRRHAQHLGYPLLGDRRYGGVINHQQDLALVASSLVFDSPFDGQPCVFELTSAEILSALSWPGSPYLSGLLP